MIKLSTNQRSALWKVKSAGLPANISMPQILKALKSMINDYNLRNGNENSDKDEEAEAAVVSVGRGTQNFGDSYR